MKLPRNWSKDLLYLILKLVFTYVKKTKQFKRVWGKLMSSYKELAIFLRNPSTSFFYSSRSVLADKIIGSLSIHFSVAFSLPLINVY